MPRRILVTSPIEPAQVAQRLPDSLDVEVVALEDRTEEGLIAAAPGVAVLIGDWRFDVPVTRKVIEAFDECLLIQQPTAGFQHIDLVAARDQGIPVANAPVNDATVAEWTVMAIIDLLRRTGEIDREMRSGGWPGDGAVRRLRELRGRTVGIVGFGRIGRAVARRLEPFECEVATFDLRQAPGVTHTELPKLLEWADIVTLHTPLTEATENFIDPFAMKQGALLVNAGRGGLVDHDRLVEALRTGHLAGAALDTFRIEPLPADDPVRSLDTVLLSSHNAGATRESGGRMLAAALENIVRVLDGGEPLYLIND